MAWEINEIKHYRVAFSGGSSYISIYGSNVDLGWIGFKDIPVPKPYKTSRDTYVVYLEKFYFPVVLDVLRNEKPVYIKYWDHSDPNQRMAYISTSNEPIGEEEHQKDR